MPARSTAALQARTITSAAGVLARLEEGDAELSIECLPQLNDVGVDTMWAEIADSIELVEALYEDEAFAGREVAALVR